MADAYPLGTVVRRGNMLCLYGSNDPASVRSTSGRIGLVLGGPVYSVGWPCQNISHDGSGVQVQGKEGPAKAAVPEAEPDVPEGTRCPGAHT